MVKAIFGGEKLTSKRQATFPVKLCEELRLSPGDEIEIEKQFINGKPGWVLRKKQLDLSWIGSLNKYTKGKSNDWRAIKKRISQVFVKGTTDD